jgi:hypothetical protein
MLIANAVWKIGNEIARAVLLSVVVFLSLMAVIAAGLRESPRYVWCGWNDVAAEIRASEAASDRPVQIYTFENLVAYHMWFALRDSERFKIAVVKGIDVRTDDETYFLPRGFDDVERANIADVNDESFWLAFRSSAVGDDAPIRDAFGGRGFKECQFFHTAYDPTTVFWVQMKRSCS